MLILSRYVDERIIITLEDGRRITLMPVAIQGAKTRIGIEAPETIAIHREEVYQELQQRPAPKQMPAA